ncbi:MAG: hypothetical protein PVG04_09350 [Anaerolineales bacterium]
MGIYTIVFAALIGILNFENPDPDARAIVYMGLSLIALWCLLGGTLMHLYRNRFALWARSLRISWKVRFVLLSTGMALLEEAVTTSLTNLAPYFGAASEAARITVSTNYFKVISTSVLAFIPWFICWAWMLGRYDFRPLEVMLLFGLTGLYAESTLDSVVNVEDLAGVGMWVFIYGLMVYLPALSVPSKREGQPPRWYDVPLAIFLPLIFVIPLVAWIIYRSCVGLLSLLGIRRSRRPFI